MAQNNKINFQLDFKKGDTSALDSLKRDIQEIQRLAGDVDFTAAADPKDLQKMIEAARALDSALTQAFDVNLNAVNIQKFNNILKQSGYNAKTLQADLSAAGYTGEKAFLNMTTQLMQFGTAVKKTNKFLDGLATTFFNTLKWGAMSSILNTLGSTIQKSFYYVKDLDTGLNDIRIVTGKSADEMERFAESANDAAKALAVTTEDYTKGSLIYYQQGLDDETVKTLTDITAKTSNVTGQGMDTVSEQLTAVWNGYKVANQAAEEGMQVYEEYVDKMAAVGATTASDLEELSTAMSKVASAASAMGVSFDDLNAQIATIVSVTRQAPESVGTALKTIYARLGDLKVDGVDEFGVKLGEVTSQLQTMGINILDQNGNMRKMSTVMTEVAAKWASWTSAQRQAAAVAMAGKRQYNNLIALFDNWDMYGEALETSLNAAGTLEKQQAIAMDSLANKMDVLKSTAEDLYDSLFDTDTVSDFVEKGTEVLQFFANFTDAVGGLNNILPMLGSIGLQVFNEQIGRGLTTMIINARNARAEIDNIKVAQQSLATMFSDSNFATGSIVNATPEIKENYQELVNFYSEMSQYQSMMNQEQKEEYKNLLEIKKTAGDLLVEIENQQRSWENTYGKLDIVNKGIEKNLVDTQAITKEMNTLSNAAAYFKSKIADSNWQNGLTNLDGLIEEISNELGISKERASAFFEIMAKADNIDDGLINAANACEEMNAALNEMANNSARVKNLNNSFKDLGQTMIQSFSTQKLMSDMTALLGVTGQLASSINTFQNLEKVWNNENLTDSEKMTQTIMNLSFLSTGLISSLNSLKKTAFGDFIVKQLEKSTAAMIANKATNDALAASYAMTDAAVIAETTSVWASITADEFQAIAEGKVTVAEVVEQKAREKNLDTTLIDTKAIEANTKAKLANAGASSAQTAAENSKKVLAGIGNTITSFLGPWGTAAAIAAAIIGSVGTILIKVKEKELKQIEELRKARAEEIDSIEQERQEKIKEIEENQKLTQSYIDLYAQYEQGTVGKEKLEEASDSVIEILGKENVAVAKLTGNYELLNQQLKEAREKELNAKIEIDQYAMDDALKGIKNIQFSATSQYSGGGAGDRLKNAYESLEGTPYQKYFETTTEYAGSSGGQNYYDYTVKLAENVADFDPYEYAVALQKIGANQELISEAIRYAANYKTAENEQFFAQLEKDLSQSNLEDLSTYEDYSQILNDTISKLQNVDGYKDYNAAFDKAIEIISQLSGNNDDFEARAIAEKQLLDKYSGKENATNLLKNLMSELSDEDLGLLLQGKVQINEQDTIESVRQTLDLAQKRFAEEDLSIAVSLRTKLTSDKNLTQKQVKEMQEELGALGAEYDQLFDFANKSELEKLDIVNSIVEEQIKVNEELASDGIEVMKEQMEEYEAAQKRLNELHEKAKYGNGLTEEETKEWEQLSEQIEATTDDYKIWQDTVENFDYGDNAFNNLIAGLDGVISKAKLLKDLAEDVGEGWVIAAEDVERFGKNFPEIVADSENYNVTQEKGFELTKQGQELYAQMLAQKKEELIAQNESYKLELQQQADARMETAKYYRAQAQHLKDYLEGKATVADTEKKLNQEVTTYAGRLAEITGENEEELHRTIQENYNATTGKAAEETGKIYDDWVGVGKVAEAASVAYENKVFEDPGLRPSGGASTGTNTTKYRQLHKEGDYAYTTSFTDEEVAKIEAQIKSLEDAATIQEDMASTEYSKIAVLDAEINAALEAMDNAASGKGSKGSKSSSKDQKDKDKKEFEDEFNRYFDIEKAIEAVDYAVKILEKDQKNLHGKELIDSLKKENELIQEQTENYQKLYDLQVKEAKEVGGKLKGLGVEFDASGAITNYAEATTAALAEYNKAVDAYNAGILDDAGFEIAEKAYENFKEQLERYEALYYSEMRDTLDKIDDNNREVLENNLKSWETEIQVQLDMNELERDWKKFFKEINNDFKKVYKDLRKESRAIAEEAASYKSDVGIDLGAVNDIMAEIDKLQAGEQSERYQSVSQAQEDLKKFNDQLIDHASTLHNLVEQAWDTYLEGIDQASDKFDDLNDKFERVNDNLEFQGELIELMYGEKAYGLMKELYAGQEYSARNQIQSVQQQLDFWTKLYNETEEGDEDHLKAQEKMNAMQDKLNDLTIDYIKLLKDDYANSIDEILDTLDKKLTGGKGSEWLSEEWERVTEFSDTYFDNLEKGYHIQTLANKVEKDISKTYKDNLKAQQKLSKYQDQVITKLKQEKNLRQEDLDIAQAKYDLLLKEIALEDARNNKTTMKLTRNEQGNWSYQYVADEEETENARQDKLDSNYNLYETASGAYNQVINEQLSAASDFTSKMKDLQMDESISQEEKNTRLGELRDQFLKESEIRQEKAQSYLDEIKIAGTALGIELYQQDQDAFTNLINNELQYFENFINTEKTDYLSLEQAFDTNCDNMNNMSKELMEATRDDWSFTASMLEELWNGDEESVRVSVNEAYESITEATNAYEDKIVELEELVGLKFHGPKGEKCIVQSIKDAEDETDRLRRKTEILVDESSVMLENLRTDLDNTTQEWNDMSKAIQNAINKLAAYMQMQGKSYTIPSPNINIDELATNTGNVASSAYKKGDNKKTPPPYAGGGNNGNKYTYVVTGEDGTETIFGETSDLQTAKNVIDYYREMDLDGYIKQGSEILKYDTGGYTGEWNGDNGRLALLHQKELVLNENDTKNLLDTVKLSRGIMDFVRQSVSNMFNSSMLRTNYNISGGTSPVQTDTGSTFYINSLEFPNANSVEEIKTAIMSLPNVASQYVNRNVK